MHRAEWHQNCLDEYPVSQAQKQQLSQSYKYHREFIRKHFSRTVSEICCHSIAEERLEAIFWEKLGTQFSVEIMFMSATGIRRGYEIK